MTTRRRRLPNLNALRAFEAAARHLSFSIAADELAVTQSAVSRQIKSLEAYFGIPLFKRLTRAVELTEGGARYASEMQDLFDRLEQASRLLEFSEKRRALTINTFPTLAMQFLVPRLSKFNIAHPEVEVRLVTSMEPVDFSGDHPDIAIRFEPPAGAKSPAKSSSRHIGVETDLKMVTAWEGVRSTLLLPGEMTPVCSQEFLTKYGPLEKPSDFCEVPLLHNIAGGRAWGDWFRAFDLPYNPANIAASFSHYFMALQAAREGLGVALVPGFESSGTDLVQLTKFTFKSGGGYYLLSLDKEWDSDPIRQFREWIMQEIVSGSH